MIFLEIIFTIFISYCISLYLKEFSQVETKKQIFYVLFTSLIIGLLNICPINILINIEPIRSIINICSYFICSKIFFKFNWKQSLIATTATFILISISQIPFVIILKIIFPDIVNIGFFISENPIYYTILNLCVCLFLNVGLIIFKIVYKKCNNFNIRMFIKNKVIIIFSLIHLIFIITLALLYTTYFGIISTNFLLIMLFTTVFYFVLSIYITYKIQQLAIEKETKKHIEIDIQTLKDVEQELSKIRHNHLNTMLELKGFIDNNDIENLRNLFEDVIEDFKVVKDNNLTSLLKIKNLGLRSIISAKLIQAENLGINVKLEINEYIDNLNINMHTLCQVVGIYFDNAIEETQNIIDKHINIICNLEENGINLIIENTFDTNKIIDLVEINKTGFSTKGANHGNGLNIANKLLDKNPNIEKNTLIIKNMFIQEIFIKK